MPLLGGVKPLRANRRPRIKIRRPERALPGPPEPALAAPEGVKFRPAATAGARRDRPEILENARRRVQDWLAARENPPFYARKWAEVLSGDVSSIAAFLVDRSELAIELRQSTPFAGALNPRERWQIWRETRERFEQAQ